jgi:hypothetical protein
MCQGVVLIIIWRKYLRAIWRNGSRKRDIRTAEWCTTPPVRKPFKRHYINELGQPQAKEIIEALLYRALEFSDSSFLRQIAPKTIRHIALKATRGQPLAEQHWLSSLQRAIQKPLTPLRRKRRLTGRLQLEFLSGQKLRSARARSSLGAQCHRASGGFC